STEDDLTVVRSIASARVASVRLGAQLTACASEDLNSPCGTRPEHCHGRCICFPRLVQVLRLEANANRLGFRLNHVPSGPGHGPTDHRKDDVHPERQERDGDRLQNAAQIEVELEARGWVP